MAGKKDRVDPCVPPQTQDALDQYLPYLVNRISSLGQAVQNRKLSGSGVNVVTLRALSILHIHGRLTVNEIAARAFAEQSTASRAIDAMVTAGLVERRVSQSDQRQRLLALTQAGSDLLHSCWPLVEDHFSMLTSGIDQHEIDICRNVLLRMIDNVKRQDT
ncbi:MarR family winged helix-turn-helix transcriptional regulator [Sphingobium sp. HBC34]|uniref:MarR family winged helix-turn-helix transcriptional regulator n=1 Tax=Sphingobium cyanobacteriorum TaxID=3063954 RepID=A0ABT8ZMD8_9SPHN|nr:MarR family winged helix-turn-helix transcriptional regulator [Sphingobium sp. HBC34]MDO7835563.1 MarR family winged helix-turn-helix transcriptional regulator [Sphingobium sp. HBC34]